MGWQFQARGMHVREMRLPAGSSAERLLSSLPAARSLVHPPPCNSCACCRPPARCVPLRLIVSVRRRSCFVTRNSSSSTLASLAVARRPCMTSSTPRKLAANYVQGRCITLRMRLPMVARNCFSHAELTRRRATRAERRPSLWRARVPSCSKRRGHMSCLTRRQCAALHT